MGVVQARIQTVEDIYRLVWTAVASKRLMEGRYHGRPRLFCPHRLGRNREGQLRVLCSNTAGRARADCNRQARRPTGAALRWRNSLRLDYWRISGAPRQTTPVLLPAWSMPISTLRIRQSAIHKKDSKGVGRTGCELSPFSMSQSSADYAARGERGAPRGRKFGGGDGADNLTWPARAEGEKRFRSLTRNP
jgi:hypothetical protein